MTDLNDASLADITAAGLDAALAREVVFWRPYQSWEQLLLVGGMDEATLERLKDRGFEILSSNNQGLPPPKPFKLSA